MRSSSADRLQPDPRWHSLSMTYEVLMRTVESWPRTPSSPPHIAEMLTVCRDLFRHSWFVYEFLTVASVHSLIAIEAALRDVLDEQPRRGGPTMWNLVEMAVSRELIAKERAEHVLTAVELRNAMLHVDRQPVITPGIAEQLIARSHAIIAALYMNETSRGFSPP